MKYHALEYHAEGTAELVKRYGEPDLWMGRKEALARMRDASLRERDSGVDGPELYSPRVWELLKDPIEATLKDLHGAVVVEACELLEELVLAAGNLAVGLVRCVLPTLLHLLGSRDSVVAIQSNSCLMTLVAHCEFPDQLGNIRSFARVTLEEGSRMALARVVKLMLEIWSLQRMVPHIRDLQGLIKELVSDSSLETRSVAKEAFAIFRSYWPGAALEMLEEPGTGPNLGSVTREELFQRSIGPPPPGISPISWRAAHRVESMTEKRVALLKQLAALTSMKISSEESEEDEPPAMRHSGSLGRRAAEESCDKHWSPIPRVGDQVWVRLPPLRNRATVRYVGEVRFAEGLWVGVEMAEGELDAWMNNDSFGGVQYFACPANRGLFVPPRSLLCPPLVPGSKREPVEVDAEWRELAARSSAAALRGWEQENDDAECAASVTRASHGRVAYVPPRLWDQAAVRRWEEGVAAGRAAAQRARAAQVSRATDAMASTLENLRGRAEAQAQPLAGDSEEPASPTLSPAGEASPRWPSDASEQSSESCGCDAVIEEIEKEAMDIVPGLETKCAATALLRTHREFLSELRTIIDRQLEVSLDLEDLAQERETLPFERLREGRDAMVEAADEAHTVVELLERRTVAVEQCYPTVYGVGLEYDLVPEAGDTAERPDGGDEQGTGWTSEESAGEEESVGSDEDIRPTRIRMMREWRGTRRIGIRGERRRRATWDLYL